MVSGGDYSMIPSRREFVIFSSSIPFRINNIQKLDKKKTDNTLVFSILINELRNRLDLHCRYRQQH
jgi:hypothetical protein